MRVCLVSQEYPPETARGGIGTQTWNKAHVLMGLGHDVQVLSCAASPDGADLRTAEESGVTVHRMRPPDGGTTVYEPATYWLGYSWSVLRQLSQLMRTNHFDVVNFPEYGAEGFAFQLDRVQWGTVPTVVHLHGPLAMFSERIGWPEPDSDFFRVATFMERLSIERADALIASSRNIADFTASYYGVERDAIEIVHCGIDVDEFAPMPQLRRRSSPTVLFVGNIAENKGATTVFEAVLRLRAKYPDILLQLFGKADDNLVRVLRRRARSAGAERNVQFGGFVQERSELPRHYARADVFCSPALHEVGVANVYVEAMACGCPVVAATTGGAPEAVQHGLSGFLVPPEDVEATASALDLIIGDPDLRARMSAAARLRAEEYFATDKYARRVLTGYQRAIERSREKLAADMSLSRR